MSATQVNSGLEGVVAAETTISLVDGQAGRLLYRGYEIGDLAAHGSFDRVVGLLLDGEWPEQDVVLPAATLSPPVLAALHGLPTSCAPLDALRTGASAFGSERRMDWPPDPDQARELIALAPAVVGAFARIRDGREPVDPAESAHLGIAGRLLHAISGEQPDPAKARALDAYFTVCAEHGLNASTFTARVVTSTQSDLASAICGAVGALKGRLHGGAPSEVRDQLTQIGDVDHAEEWLRGALARGERLMGFGHRVYKTMDPRARALRGVAEELASDADWLKLAIEVEDVALRLLAEHKPDRPLKTNVEYYASIVLDGVGLMTDLYTPAFAVARTAGWCAHALEQAAHGRLIRPDALYVGPAERPLPRGVTTDGAGWALRSRDVVTVVLLSLVLFPFYPLFWYLRLSSELRRELRTEPGTPNGSPVWLTGLMVTFGWGLLVVPAISFYETAWRIRRIQRRRAMPQSAWYSFPFLTGLLLIAFVGPLVLPGGWWAQIIGWGALVVMIGTMQHAVNRVAMEPAPRRSSGRRALLWIVSLPYAVILVATAGLFGSGQLQLVRVNTTAMAPAIQCGDEVMVESAAIHGPLGVGDIVMFGHNGKTLMSRVADVAGQQLTVRNDNPGNGSDSRALGPISKSDVSSVVYAVEWPISHLGPLGTSPTSGTARSCP